MKSDFPILSSASFEDLKEKALKAGVKKARICAHPSIEATLHEMFIYHAKEAYVRPHKHINKIESFTVMEGEADAIFYDEQGAITRIIPLGKSKERAIYYRLSTPTYHSLVIRSDYILFYEATQGPFKREDTLFSEWSPEEGSESLVQEFLHKQEKKIEFFLKNSSSEENKIGKK